MGKRAQLPEVPDVEGDSDVHAPGPHGVARQKNSVVLWEPGGGRNHSFRLGVRVLGRGRGEIWKKDHGTFRTKEECRVLWKLGGRDAFWKGDWVQILKDMVCQAREFALYLVINRELLRDFNPGADMITPVFWKIMSLWRGRAEWR